MTSNARGGTRILGSLRSEKGKGVVRMEDRFDTDIRGLISHESSAASLPGRGQPGRPSNPGRPCVKPSPVSGNCKARYARLP